MTSENLGKFLIFEKSSFIVPPIYSSDFWGCLKLPKNNPIENLYMSFCKTLLGVQKQTTNIGVLLELGAVPIMFFGVKNCLKNWHRIHKKHEANIITLKVHQMATEHNLPWTIVTKHHLDSKEHNGDCSPHKKNAARNGNTPIYRLLTIHTYIHKIYFVQKRN